MCSPTFLKIAVVTLENNAAPKTFSLSCPPRYDFLPMVVPYSCNGRKHRCKHVSDSVLSSFDTREHFDYNITSLTSIVINFSVSSSCNDRSSPLRHVSSLVSSCIANLSQRDTAKKLLIPLRLIARMNYNYNVVRG